MLPMILFFGSGMPQRTLSRAPRVIFLCARIVLLITRMTFKQISLDYMTLLLLFGRLNSKTWR